MVAGFKRWIFAGLLLIALSFYSLKGWLGEHLARESSSKSWTRRITNGGVGSRGGGKHEGVDLARDNGDLLIIDGEILDVGVRGSSNKRVGKKDAGSSNSEGGGDDCSDPTLERAEYSHVLVDDVLSDLGSAWAPGALSGGWHSIVNEACPQFVAMHQNHGAGIGHRLVGYTMALHTAIWFNLTFAHTGLDGGAGQHGNYDGWDAWLGFTNGEVGFDIAAKRPNIKRVNLPSLGGKAGYQYNELMIDHWKGHFQDPANCNTLFILPTDNWAFDVSATTKFTLSRKFERNQIMHKTLALAAAAAEATTKNTVASTTTTTVAKLTPSYTAVWNTKAVNIAVHVRVGDQMPTPEFVMTRIVTDTILPSLTALHLQAPIHIHVFAEGKGKNDFKLFANLPNVFFYPDMPAQETFYHLTQSDFLVGSFSSFSWAAGQVSDKPLYFSQPSSDIFRMCGDAAACCYGCVSGKCDHRSGDCSDNAKYRMKIAARRIARLERCGLLV